MREIVKNILKTNKVGIRLYEIIHRLYRLYSIPHKRRMLRRKGVDALKRLAGIFEQHSIPAFAAYGTLLGFVRENGFLSSDGDIDIGVLPGVWSAKEVLRVFLEREKGFTFVHGFTYAGRLTEFTLKYKDLGIDFFFYLEEGGKFYAGSYHYVPGVNYPTANANSAQRVVEPKIQSLTKMHIFGVDFPIPADVETVLEGLYGNWRVPDANWSDSKHPGIEDLPGYAYRVTNVKELI